jgi:hypothetical protein
MKAYFHSLEPVVMPRADYVKEHIRLVKALSSGDTNALNNELVEQRADLGNALHGGRGRASGFIMRAMAENKLKHSGQYKNPTFPLAPGSKMNKPIEFDWKKLANKNQGGTPDAGQKTHWGTKGDYGASPFILHHFSGSPTQSKPVAKESDIQKKARLIFTAKKLLDKAKEATAPIVNAAPVIEHFGNAAELSAPAPEPNPPPSAPAPEPEVVAPAPVEAAPKVRRVLKTKKATPPKVAETPTPPNPAPKTVWTAAELARNPVTRMDTINYYNDDLDTRQKALLLFALNNPKAKLADAIKYLKDNDIGKGFSLPTISPIFKTLRKDADDILAEEEKQSKTLSNPAYTAIKSKLDSLLANKSARPLEKIKNAFKGIDVEKYLNIYNTVTEKGGAKGAYDMDKKLKYEGSGKWRLFVGKKYGKTYSSLISVESGIEPDASFQLEDHKWQYGAATYWADFTKEFDVTDGEGNKVSVRSNCVLEGLHKVEGKWEIAEGDIAIYIKSSEFKDPDETPRERAINSLSGAQRKFAGSVGKAMSKIFYNRALYEYNQSYWIGDYITQWAADKERKEKIGYARQVKAMIKEMENNDYLYKTKYNDVEYVCPKKRPYSYAPKETPEERKVVGAPVKPPERPKEWTSDNINRLGEKEETENWWDGLSPTERKVVLWHLNNTTDFSMNSPEIPEGRGRASDLRKEAKVMLEEFNAAHKKYDEAKTEYEYSRKKKGGAYKLNEVSEADAKNPEETKVLPIRNKARFRLAKDRLLAALTKYTVPPVSTRAALLGKESGMMAGKKGEGAIARGVAFGFGNNRRGYDYFVKNKAHPEVYEALVELGDTIVPKGWDYQTIQLNHNAKAKKHLDKNNVGKSVIIGIGDYTGGELRVFSPDSSKYHDYNIKNRPTMFNGAVLPHETQPFSNPTEYEKGRGRYTIVYFRHKYKPGSGNVGVGSGKHDIDTMVGKGMRQPSAAALEDLFV